MKNIQLNLPLRFASRALLRCSMPRPGNELHHLCYDAKRGWECRLTVHALDKSGKIITSKRLRWRWGKISEATAILKRDASIAALEKIGLKIESRQLVRGIRAA